MTSCENRVSYLQFKFCNWHNRYSVTYRKCTTHSKLFANWFFFLENGSQWDEFNIFPGSLYLQTTHDIKVSPFTYLFCSLCLCEIGKIKECEIILIEDKKKEEKLRFAEVASCDFNLATEFASPKLIPWQLVFSFFST